MLLIQSFLENSSSTLQLQCRYKTDLAAPVSTHSSETLCNIDRGVEGLVRAKKAHFQTFFFVESVTELRRSLCRSCRSGHDFYLVNKTCSWFVISKPITRTKKYHKLIIAKSVIAFSDYLS